MNNKLNRGPINSARADATLAPANASGREEGGARKEIVAGSGPHLSEETQSLLRSRLRAAAWILLLGFGVFLVRHVVGVLTSEPLNPWWLGYHTLVVLALVVSVMLLYRRRPMSLGKLRVAELVIFGLPTVFFLWFQYRMTVAGVARGFMPPTLSFWLLLIFTYGMFIPNTWRRAAYVIGAMALVPVLLFVGMLLADTQVAAVTTGFEIIQHVLVMLITAVAAIFGTHLINTLRREAFEARQLGQYRLIAPLGAGGMGEVFLAEHQMLKRPCAVKLIRPKQAGDPKVLARFEREVQMTARLSHWNTIEIYDFGRTEDGTFFYVMEYLPGLSLELLLRHGPLPAERVVYLLRQTCQALREAHGIGLIHRDIKPANIFASQRGGLYDVVKLLDFGLVKPVAEIPSARLTQDGALSGTPLFMSPEQGRGLADVDARSDIYSLGAVAYNLLSGRPPFERDSPLEVLIAHARDEVAPLSQIHPDVPADLEQIVLRCLAKHPDDRFQDADSLDQALSACTAANQWTSSHAAHWWREHGQSTLPTQEMGTAATV